MVAVSAFIVQEVKISQMEDVFLGKTATTVQAREILSFNKYKQELWLNVLIFEQNIENCLPVARRKY